MNRFQLKIVNSPTAMFITGAFLGSMAIIIYHMRIQGPTNKQQTDFIQCPDPPAPICPDIAPKNVEPLKQQTKRIEVPSEPALSEIFKLITNAAPQQKLIDENVLYKTLRYSIEERDQYDPELVEFVKTLIVKPPIADRANLPKQSVSEFGQDKYVDSMLQSRRDGFFVEAGAYDGMSGSNTLFFEANRNWTGLLVEAVPEFYKHIPPRKRNVYAINCCLTKSYPKVLKMQVAAGWSGRLDVLNEKHKAVVQHEIETHGYGNKILFVPCFSINTILRAINVRHVDLFSLDVEGAELDVLSGLDFQNVTYSAFVIEHPHVENGIAKFDQLLGANGFKQTKAERVDVYYLHGNTTEQKTN